MKIKARSKWQVLADLTDKLKNLPPKHPDRSILARMIVGLRAELTVRPETD
jgi:hypothetical protein